MVQADIYQSEREPSPEPQFFTLLPSGMIVVPDVLPVIRVQTRCIGR